MPRMLALAVLLALVLPKPLAFASPPDATWLGGIYDRADGDDVVMRTMSRVGMSAAAAVVPRPVGRRELATAADIPGYECRRPVADARGPPPAGRLLGALPSAAAVPVEYPSRILAAPPPEPCPLRRADPARPPGRFASLRGPPATPAA